MGRLLDSSWSSRRFRVHRRVAPELVSWTVELASHHGVTRLAHMTTLLFCRFPFYWEIKTLLFLFLSLPQFEARAQQQQKPFPTCYSSHLFPLRHRARLSSTNPTWNRTSSKMSLTLTQASPLRAPKRYNSSSRASPRSGTSSTAY